MRFVKIGFLFLFVTVFVNSTSAVVPSFYAKASKNKGMAIWVDSVFSTLTLEEQIGQLIMPTVDPYLTKVNEDKLMKLVKEQKVGGLLFTKSTIENQGKMTNLMQKNAKVPLFISLDGEWGLSMRIEGTTRFPKNIALGALKNNQLIYEYGREVARQCKLMGIQINFAPVLDINNNPKNPVINIRSFGQSRDRVADAAIAYAKGLEYEGVISVGKHFPGHGDTNADSHKALPIVDLPLSRLDSVELYPFKKYIRSGLAGMMVGHLYLPAFDQDTIPASLSHSIVTDLLRNELDFQGLVFTDALIMKAITDKNGSPCVQALLAGHDILLCPSNPMAEIDSVKNAIANGILSLASIQARCKKVLSYKYACGLNKLQPIDLYSLNNRLNTRDGEVLNRRMAAESITLLKNTKKIIPIRGIDKQTIAVVTVGEKNSVFQSVANLYTEVANYQLTDPTTTDELNEIVDKVKRYTTVILNIHSDKANYTDQLKLLMSKLDENTDVIINFLISPYKVDGYAELIKQAKGVLMSYENTPLIQNYSAQLLFGGIGAKGKLPSAIQDQFALGTGLITEKSRLSYEMAETVGVDPYKLGLIDNIVEKAIQNKAFPGCQVLVAKEGAVIYHKAFGSFEYNDKNRVSTNDIYDLASVTKAAATTSAMMLLYDREKYTLREPLSKYIPELQNTNKASITIKDALYHETGMPSFIPFNQMLLDEKSVSGPIYSKTKSKKYPILVDNSTYGQKGIKFKSELVSTKQTDTFSLKVANDFYINRSFSSMMMNKLISAKLGPKNHYNYSDLNFMLLRRLVENLSGTTIDTLVRRDLFARLGSTTTVYQPLRYFNKLRIVPTEDDKFFRRQLLDGYPHDEIAALSGGVEGNAGLFSNANDLAKLCQMLLNGGTYGGENFLQKSTIEMFSQMKSPNSRRGLGFDKPEPVKPSTGPTNDLAPLSTYGHTGFTGTCFWVDPDNQLIYIFLSNRVNPSRANRKINSLKTRELIQGAIYRAIQNKK